MPVLVQPGVPHFLYDLRHAARALRRPPGFLAVVVVTLGFGIGINTATFSIVNAVLIRPLAFDAPERLVALQEQIAGAGLENGPFSPPDFIDVQRDQQSFEGIAAYVRRPAELSGGATPERIDVSKVSWNLFDVLGVRPMIGRPFTPEEDRPGVDVAILSYGLWARLGGDRSIVGRTIALDRRPYTVVGVMPSGFEFPLRGSGFNGAPAAAWVPMGFGDRQLQVRGNEFNHGVVARLKAGTSIDAARAELDVLAGRVNDSYPPVLRNARFSISFVAMPLREETTGPIQRPLLF